MIKDNYIRVDLNDIVGPIVFGIIAAIFVISATFINIVVVNTKVSFLYPWSVPVLLSPHENVGRSFVPSISLFIILLITFMIGIAVSIKKYKYIE